jgi:hypothetical protein
MDIEAGQIDNGETLTEVFGQWPSFHDAEVHGIRLDRGCAGPPSLAADIHVFQITSVVTPDGYYALENHTLLTLHFRGVDQLELGGFNHQNVLLGLELNDISARQLDVLRWEVAFDSSFGVSARFLCEGIGVLGAEPFEPQEFRGAPSGTQSPARPTSHEGTG